MITITREVLPPAYRHLTPRLGYPIQAGVKTHIAWLCDVCGVEIWRSLDNMRAAPVPAEADGCPMCRVARRISRQVSQQTHAHIHAWRYWHDHPQAQNAERRAEALLLTVVCPRGHMTEMGTRDVKHALRPIVA